MIRPTTSSILTSISFLFKAFHLKFSGKDSRGPAVEQALLGPGRLVPRHVRLLAVWPEDQALVHHAGRQTWRNTSWRRQRGELGLQTLKLSVFTDTRMNLQAVIATAAKYSSSWIGQFYIILQSCLPRQQPFQSYLAPNKQISPHSFPDWATITLTLVYPTFIVLWGHISHIWTGTAIQYNSLMHCNCVKRQGNG